MAPKDPNREMMCITYRIPNHIWKKLKHIAFSTGEPVSKFVLAAIIEKLNTQTTLNNEE